jgi:hypothetical protein
MTNSEEHPGPEKRGQDAYLAQRDEIAARNSEAMKRGREERAARDAQSARRRLAQERVQDAESNAIKPDFKS